MIEIVDPTDPRAVRNAKNLLAFYERAFKDKQPVEAASELVAPDYVQHNPQLANGSKNLGEAFAAVVKERANFHVVVHRVIATGDWAWAHLNFINLYTDDPNDLGIAGVDIWRMSDDGIALEHWDVLQPVAESVSPLNGNGVF